MSCVYFAAILEAKYVLPTSYYGPVWARKYVVVWHNQFHVSSELAELQNCRPVPSLVAMTEKLVVAKSAV